MALNLDDPFSPSTEEDSDFYKSSRKAFREDVLGVKSQPEKLAPGSPSEPLAPRASSVPQQADSGFVPAYKMFRPESFQPASNSEPSNGGDLPAYKMFGYQAPAVEVKPEPVKKDEESGDFFRGAGTSLQQTPALIKGALGLVGATAESAFGKGGVSTALKEWGFEGFKKGMAEAQSDAKETDSITTAWEQAKNGNLGALVDWAQYGLGYMSGSVAETAATSLLGAVAGGAVTGGPGAVPGAVAGAVEGQATKGFLKTLVESAVEKEAARLAEQTGGKVAAEELTKQATKNVAKDIGSTATLLGVNFAKEAGGIYGDAQEEAIKEGRELDAGDLSRIWATGALAALTETAVDKLGLDAAAGKIKLPGNGRIGRTIVGGAVGGGIEGGTEAIQTAIERYGAGKDLLSPDAIREYVDSGALGAIGGGSVGAATGFFRSGEETSGGQTTPRETSNGTGNIGGRVSEDSAIGGDTFFGRPFMDENILRERMGNVKFMNFVAAVYDQADDATKKNIEQLVDRTSSRENFNDALKRESRMEEGRSLLERDQSTGEAAKESDWFVASMDRLLAGQNPQGTNKRPAPPRQLNQADLDRMDEDGRIDALLEQGQQEIDRINAEREQQGKPPVGAGSAPAAQPSILERGTEGIDSAVSSYSNVATGLDLKTPEAAKAIALVNRRKMITEGFTSEEADAIFGRFINPNPQPAVRESQNQAPAQNLSDLNALGSTQPASVVPTPSENAQTQQSASSKAVASILPIELKNDFSSWLKWTYSDTNEASNATSSENLRDTEVEFLTLMANTEPRLLKNKSAGQIAKSVLNDLRRNDRRPQNLADDEINAKFEEAKARFGQAISSFDLTKFNVVPENTASGKEILSALADLMYWLVRKGVRSFEEAVRQAKSGGFRADTISSAIVSYPISNDQFRKAYDDAVAAVDSAVTPGLARKQKEIERQLQANKPATASNTQPNAGQVTKNSLREKYTEAKSRVIANSTRENAVAFRDVLQDKMFGEARKSIGKLGGMKKVNLEQIAEVVDGVQASVESVIGQLPPKVQELFVKNKTVDRIAAEVNKSLNVAYYQETAPKVRESENIREEYAPSAADKDERRRDRRMGKKIPASKVMEEVRNMSPVARAAVEKSGALKKLPARIAEEKAQKEKERQASIRAKAERKKYEGDPTVVTESRSGYMLFFDPQKVLPLTDKSKEATLFNKYRAELGRIMTMLSSPERQKYAETMRGLDVAIRALESTRYYLRRNPNSSAEEVIKGSIKSLEGKIERGDPKAEVQPIIDYLKQTLEQMNSPMPSAGIEPASINNEEIVSNVIGEMSERYADMASDDTRSRGILFFQNYIDTHISVGRLRQQAIKDGLPSEMVERLFGPARQEVQWVVNNMNRGNMNVEDAIDSAVSSGQLSNNQLDQEYGVIDEARQEGLFGRVENAVRLIQDLVNNKEVLGLNKTLQRGIEEGEFTRADVEQAYKMLGIDPPADFIKIGGYLPFQNTLTQYINKHWDSDNPVGAWMTSMYNLQNNPNIPSEEKARVLRSNSSHVRHMYMRFRGRINQLARRRNESEYLFPSALYHDYTLSEMENTKLIKDPLMRSAIEYLYPTPDERVHAWMKDVMLLHRVKPGIAGRFLDNSEDSPIVPADAARYREWFQRNKRIRIDKIKRQSKFLTYGRLGQLPNVPESVLSKYRIAIIHANQVQGSVLEAEADALNRDVVRLRSQMKGKSESVIRDAVDRMIDERIKELKIDDQLRSETIDAIADRIITRKRGTDAMDVVAEGYENQDRYNEASSEKDEGDLSPEDFEGLGQDEDSLRARRGSNSGVMSAMEVVGIVERINLDAGGNLPKIVTLQNIYQLPESILQRILKKHGPNPGAKGLFDAETGTTYLFADFMANASDVEFTVFHEVFGHYGMRGVLGDRLNTFLDTLYKTNPKIRQMTDALMKEERIGKLEAVEEVLADLAMNGEVGPIQRYLGKVASFIKPFMPRVAAWLESKLDVRSIPDVAWILKEAKNYGRNGGKMVFNGVPSEIRLQEAPPPYEMYSLNGKTVTGYARYNPVMGDWYVFMGQGGEIRDGQYTTMIVNDVEQVQAMLRSTGGKIEMRTRSAYYVDDNTPMQLNSYDGFQDPNQLSWWQRFKRSATIQIQNEWLPIFERVKFLESKYGRLNDRENVMKSILLYESRAKAILDDFESEYVAPIQRLLEKFGEAGGNREDIRMWLIARHADERNRVIDRLTKGKNKSGSGMTGDKADQILKDTEQRLTAEQYSILKQIGDMTDRMSRDKVRWMYDKGLITADQAEALNQYEHYVPLRDGEVDDRELAGGRKINLRGSDARRATGRGKDSFADNILENALLDFQSVLIRGEKNVVANTLLNMIERFPDPTFARVNILKYKQKVQKDGTTRSVPIFRDDGSVDSTPTFIGMRELPNYEIVTERDTSYINNPQVMVVKVGGRPVTIEFDEEGFGTFLDAIHGSMQGRQVGAINEFIGSYNRIFGQMLTSWNPVWVFVNGFRDVQTAIFNAVSDERITKDQAAKMVKAMPSALNAAMSVYMKDTKGWGWFTQNYKPGANQEMLDMLDELRKEGGLTLFMDRDNLESVSRSLRIALEGPTNTAERIEQKTKAVAKFMEGMTAPIEVMPRLAAYYALRKTGWSASDAAVFAKDLTVNFNMRGQARWLRNLYVFFNPAVQGTEKLIRLAKSNPKRFWAVAGAWGAFGALMNMVARGISPGDEDDEDDPIDQLDKVPDYKRATSIIIAPDMPGGSIPLAYGWNAFYAAGHFAMDYFLGKQPLSVVAGRTAKAAVEAFLPQSSGLEKSTLIGKLASVGAPTPASPIVDLLMNENRFGAPIYRPKNQFDLADESNAYMHFESVSPISKWTMRSLNSITGGNRYESGLADINPAVFDYLLQSYLPGLPAETYKSASTAVRLSRGEELARTPLPVIDRFSAYVPQGFDSGAYRRVGNMVEDKWKLLRDPNTPESLRKQIREEYPEIGSMHAVVTSVKQSVRELRSTLRQIENNPGISDEEKVQRRNEFKEKERQLYNRFVSRAIERGFREEVVRPD